MKLLASDYDGTLRTESKVSEQDKKAIHEWRKAGNIFGIVTGRSMESIRNEIAQNNIEIDFVVGNNGGVVYDADFQELQSKYIQFDKAKDIIAYLRREVCISYVLNDGYYRSKVVLDAEREDIKYASFTGNLSEAEVLHNRKIAQIVASLDKDEDCERIANHINAYFKGYAVGFRNINCVDIAPYGVSKSTGLSYMVKHLHIPVQQVYTIGDSYNDIAMLETYHGYAMKQAPLQVKSYADQVVNSVADCINHLQLSEN